MSKKTRMTQAEFLEKAETVHKVRYGYENSRYVNSVTPVTIVCPVHGEFSQSPNSHLSGHGCPKCGVEKVKALKLITQADFLKRARDQHGGTYIYSKSVYSGAGNKVEIICRKHGSFFQTATSHLQGRGCRKCAAESTGRKISLSLKDFIRRSREAHGKKFDYTKVQFSGTKSKVEIICPVHGNFWQAPGDHMAGRGCEKCSGTAKLTNKEFIEQCKKVHGNRYDYSKTKYNGNRTPVTIICHQHGPFQQIPYHHKRGVGCPRCGTERGSEKMRGNLADFIAAAVEVHGDKYVYENVKYEKAGRKVEIICPQHGPFSQTPASHLSGRGCRKCADEALAVRFADSLEDFVRKAKVAHKKYYDYSNVIYKNSNVKVAIVCPEHGVFLQTPASHLSGQGCPFRHMPKGEKAIYDYLKSREIPFNFQYKFSDLVNVDGNRKLIVDFFVETLNCVIEFDGQQHFSPTLFASSISAKMAQFTFARLRANDRLKDIYCTRNSIKMIRIPYSKLKKVTEILDKAFAA